MITMIMDILVGLFMVVTLALVMFGEPFAEWIEYRNNEETEIIDVEVIEIY